MSLVLALNTSLYPQYITAVGIIFKNFSIFLAFFQ